MLGKGFQFFSLVDLLGYTSPLSISLASSDGLSISLRSTTTELRNIQPLVIQPSSSASTAFDQPIASGSQPTLQRQQSIHDDTIPIATQSYKKK